MSRQVPHGPEDLDCPFYREAMSKRCHKCPMWTQLRGTNPQTGAEVDHWNCAFAQMPLLSMETSKMMFQTRASIDEFRNETARARGELQILQPPNRTPRLR